MMLKRIFTRTECKVISSLVLENVELKVALKENTAQFQDKLNIMQAQMDHVEDKFSGIDLEEWSSLQAERKAIAEKELIEKGDVDSLINSRVDEAIVSFRVALSAQTRKSNQELESLTFENNNNKEKVKQLCANIAEHKYK